MKSRELQNHLTSEFYFGVLELVGLSTHPMFAKEIRSALLDDNEEEHERIKKNISYLYDALIYLVPSSDKTIIIRLFEWNKPPDEISRIKRLISRLNFLLTSLYRVQANFLEIEYVGTYFKKDEKLVFDTPNNYTLNISQKGTPKLSVKIEANEKEEIKPILSVIINGKVVKNDKLRVRKSKGRTYLSAVGYQPIDSPMRFLFATKFPSDDRRTIEQIKREIRNAPTRPWYINEYELLFLPDSPGEEIEDWQRWRFRLNIRGLLKYILLIIEYERNKNVEPSRISGVLRNLSKHFSSDFPFLLNYMNFEKEYKLLERNGIVRRNFLVHLIKEIAQRLRSFVLNSGDIRFLMYLVIKEYSTAILSPFRSPFYLDSINNIGLKHISSEELKNYQRRNLYHMKEYLRGAFEATEEEYNQTAKSVES